jgi:hypothetical protein
MEVKATNMVEFSFPFRLCIKRGENRRAIIDLDARQGDPARDMSPPLFRAKFEMLQLDDVSTGCMREFCIFLRRAEVATRNRQVGFFTPGSRAASYFPSLLILFSFVTFDLFLTWVERAAWDGGIERLGVKSSRSTNFNLRGANVMESETVQLHTHFDRHSYS